SRRRHTRFSRDWSSDVCSSDLKEVRNNFGKIYNIPQQITWAEDGGSFVYKLKQKDNKSILVLVDAQAKSKKIIDLEAMSEQMSKLLSETVPLNNSWFVGLKPINNNEIEFTEKKKVWRWNEIGRAHV